MKRRFIILSQAWYANANLMGADYTDEIVFGMYGDGGGTSGEMALTWSKVGPEIMPNLTVYDDAWWLLKDFSDVLEQLTNNPHRAITPDQFADMLTKCGFEDVTPHTDPKA